MTQKTALNILKLGHTTFLTGQAGSGKSYVLREYIDYLKKHGMKYAVTASTGIASTHISGSTIHSWSGIGIKDKLTKFDLDALEEKQNLYKRWTETQVLIIDEVSMLHANFLDMLNKLAKHIRRNDKPFGGMQLIFSGDFFQLPPVVRSENHAPGSKVYAFLSDAWVEAKPVICYLTEQHRQDDDKLLSLLRAIRSGEIEEEHYETLKEVSEKKPKSSTLKLYTHNENVDKINEKFFEELDGDEHYYEMITKGKKNLIDSLKNNCLAPETLRIKIGTKVMCIKNAQDKSYVNGSLGVVTDLADDGYPIVTLATGRKITVRGDTWKVEEDGKVRAEISQLPLRYAWAITVHKSQGMTLDEAEMDLSRTFVRGQGYVALSRLTTLEGLYLTGFNNEALMVSEEVREADELFHKKSTQAEDALGKYSSDVLDGMHNKRLLEVGGSLQEVDEVDDEVKVLSHIVTKEMLDKGMTIEEVAKMRDITGDTVIAHIEKLTDQGEVIILEHTLPKKSVLQKINSAFDTLDTTKLTPVFDELGGKVSYGDIKLVRAYRSLQKKSKK
jgi:ATP-dependent exoDNAse (exonuclease V) alpha subunit